MNLLLRRILRNNCGHARVSQHGASTSATVITETTTTATIVTGVPRRYIWLDQNQRNIQTTSITNNAVSAVPLVSTTATDPVLVGRPSSVGLGSVVLLSRRSQSDKTYPPPPITTTTQAEEEQNHQDDAKEDDLSFAERTTKVSFLNEEDQTSDDLEGNRTVNHNKRFQKSLDPSEYTEQVKVRLPEMDDGEGRIVRWYKEEGDIVLRNDVLCDVETESFTFGMQTDDEYPAILGPILVQASETKTLTSKAVICILWHKKEQRKGPEKNTDEGRETKND